MKPYYYIFKSSGYPPSKRHETLESVEEEAKRLAMKHPGQQFEILQCIGITSIPVTNPSTFWLNKTESPERLKYESLVEGDIIQEGDEFWGPEKAWIKTSNVGSVATSYTHKMYRRPLR